MWKKIFGYAWAAPVTAIGLLYATACWALGWYKWEGIHGDGLVWSVSTEKSPGWLLKLWMNWNGHAIGNAVVLRHTPEEIPVTLVHELKHVDQVMRLGIFHPVIYGLNMAAIKLGCPGSHPYYDNIFEIDARRHAGQPVDVTQRKS
jgi:hypothetical protein